MDTPTFNVLSVCTGGGGLDRGLHLAVRNARVVCAVEIEAFAAVKLADQMASAAVDDAPIWTDLRTFDGRPWRGLVDCLIGGYPCQPFSVAGLQRGADDPRHLWPHVERVIEESNPWLVFLENVAGHLKLGYREVRTELQRLGYRVTQGLFAASEEEVGAPHDRVRLFILAYSAARRQRQGFGLLRAPGGQSDAGRTGEALDDSYRLVAGRFEYPRTGAVGHPSEATGRGQALADADGDALRVEPERDQLDRRRARAAECEYTGARDDGKAVGLAERARLEGLTDRTHAAGREVADGSIGPARGELADAGVDGRRERGPAHDDDGRDAPGHEPDGCDSRVADTAGRGLGVLRESSELAGQLDRRYAGLEPFPPGPGDVARWRAILERWPELAPATSKEEAESAIRLLADGMADRVDWLRLFGNGVVPQQAAYAFVTLLGELLADGD